jgi:hypothetical protein
MHAATAAWALYADADAPSRAAAIGEILAAENGPAVRAILVRELWRDAAKAADAVDDVLDRIFDAAGDAVADPGDDAWRGLIALLAHLALVPKTSAALARQSNESVAALAAAECAVQRTLLQVRRLPHLHPDCHRTPTRAPYVYLDHGLDCQATAIP